MIYPKCLYKTREISKVANNEKEHRLMAKNGWLDIWTDKEPHDFEEYKIISGGNIGIGEVSPNPLFVNAGIGADSEQLEILPVKPKKKRSRKKKVIINESNETNKPL